MTADNDGLILGLALNYSSRVEIEDIVKKIVLEFRDGKIGYEDISQRGADLPSFLVKDSPFFANF